ncbi:nucleolar protein 6 [Tanacetum coccineum]
MLNEERKRFAKYFPAVICDLSAHFNIAHRMKKAESYQVKRVSPTNKYLFLRSQHSSMINGLSGRYPLYGPVVPTQLEDVLENLTEKPDVATMPMEKKRFAKYFLAVICDLSAHFNIAHRMTKGRDDWVLYETTIDRASLLPCSTLLIDNEGNLKLADFGLARIYSGDHRGNLTNRVISL